jgi:hypothetical protein
MGQAHRFAAQLLAAGRNGRLAMDRLPHIGQMATMSADATSFVTDSAAAATAIATGVKTINGTSERPFWNSLRARVDQWDWSVRVRSPTPRRLPLPPMYRTAQIRVMWRDSTSSALRSM